jgi:hypothetical protein
VDEVRQVGVAVAGRFDHADALGRGHPDGLVVGRLDLHRPASAVHRQLGLDQQDVTGAKVVGSVDNRVGDVVDTRRPPFRHRPGLGIVRDALDADIILRGDDNPENAGAVILVGMVVPVHRDGGRELLVVRRPPLFNVGDADAEAATAGHLPCGQRIDRLGGGVEIGLEGRVGVDRRLSLDPPRCFAVWRRLSYEKGP